MNMGARRSAHIHDACIALPLRADPHACLFPLFRDSSFDKFLNQRTYRAHRHKETPVSEIIADTDRMFGESEQFGIFLDMIQLLIKGNHVIRINPLNTAPKVIAEQRYGILRLFGILLTERFDLFENITDKIGTDLAENQKYARVEQAQFARFRGIISCLTAVTLFLIQPITNGLVILLMNDAVNIIVRA